MGYPSDLLYSKTHEWVKFDGDSCKIGLTDHAAGQMGDLVYLNLPEVGEEVTMGESAGDIESVKTVSEFNCPVSGTVSAVNEEVADDPALINENAYDAWMIEISEVTEKEELMDAAGYEAFVAEEG